MDNNQAKPLGGSIKKLRKKQGLSQDALARKANIPYTTFVKIETGLIKNPSIFRVQKIAKALDISLDDLLA